MERYVVTAAPCPGPVAGDTTYQQMDGCSHIIRTEYYIDDGCDFAAASCRRYLSYGPAITALAPNYSDRWGFRP